MITKVDAIYKLNSSVVSTRGDVAYDVNGDVVNYDNDAVEAEALKMGHREKRDQLLADTDWWAGSDHTMTQAQTTYRQALRDITDHANWPNLSDSDWPTKP